MDSKLKYLLMLPILSAMLSSCQSYLHFSESTPPAIQLQEGQDRIGFINYYDYTLAPGKTEKAREVHADGVKSIISSLEESFSRDSLYELFIIDSLVSGMAMEGMPEPISEELARDLCREYSVEMLLLLDSYNIYFNTESEGVGLIEAIITNSEPDMTNYVDLVTEAGLSLYDSSGAILDRVVATEGMTYQTRPALTSLIVIDPSIKKAGKEVTGLGNIIGRNYLASFYPGSIHRTEMIYAGKAFKESNQRMLTHDWVKAIQLLEPLTESDKAGLSRKANHNMMVAKKASGANKQ